MKDRNKSPDRGRKEGNFCFRRELKTITIKSTSDGPAFHVWSYSTAPVSGCFARKTSVPTGIIFSLTHHYLSTTPHQMCFFLFIAPDRGIKMHCEKFGVAAFVMIDSDKLQHSEIFSLYIRNYEIPFLH